jgi:hypothetical protein
MEVTTMMILLEPFADSSRGEDSDAKDVLPREKLHDIVAKGGYKRPTPKKWQKYYSTSNNNNY